MQLVDTLNGKTLDCDVDFYLIDVRYPYEYAGGHIPSAINLMDPIQLERFFVNGPPMKRTVIVFHCEYSIQRAPQM
jgi:rhodanese-related sulfurtransferase